MLLLTRNREERVIITLSDGRRIVVTVTDIWRDKVRIGFEADQDIAIHREEVLIRMEREREEVSHGT